MTAYISTSLLMLNNIPFYGYITHFKNPFTSWWTLGYFHLLAVMDNATVNIHVQVLGLILKNDSVVSVIVIEEAIGSDMVRVLSIVCQEVKNSPSI
jgi:hypothetical protein